MMRLLLSLFPPRAQSFIDTCPLVPLQRSCSSISPTRPQRPAVLPPLGLPGNRAPSHPPARSTALEHGARRLSRKIGREKQLITAQWLGLTGSAPRFGKSLAGNLVTRQSNHHPRRSLHRKERDCFA